MLNTWINEAKNYTEENGNVVIDADKGTDYFIDPCSDFVAHNAHIYARVADGDFTFQCKVQPDFQTKYDAGAIMYYIDDERWIKFAFEYTDLGHKAVVGVVTNEVSDDANGEKIERDAIHLKMAKKDKVIGLYFSRDGENWRMARLFRYDVSTEKNAYIGVEAQSPVGEGCTVEFSEITYRDTAPEDMREGK